MKKIKGNVGLWVSQTNSLMGPVSSQIYTKNLKFTSLISKDIEWARAWITSNID